MWSEITKYVLNNYDVEASGYGMAGKVRIALEHCPKSIDSTEEAKTVAAIVDECERHGLNFENKGKFPNDYVPPQPEPEPQPDPQPDPTPVPPVKPPFSWNGWLKNRLPWIVGIIIAIIVIALLVIR
jgi:hypothetical protein